MFQSREPEYWGFDRVGQPSVFVGNWLIRALFVGLPRDSVAAVAHSSLDHYPFLLCRNTVISMQTL
jgi:hypothetical protein